LFIFAPYILVTQMFERIEEQKRQVLELEEKEDRLVNEIDFHLERLLKHTERVGNVFFEKGPTIYNFGGVGFSGVKYAMFRETRYDMEAIDKAIIEDVDEAIFETLKKNVKAHVHKAKDGSIIIDRDGVRLRIEKAE